jgi:hypothetical protein
LGYPFECGREGAREFAHGVVLSKNEAEKEAMSPCVFGWGKYLSTKIGRVCALDCIKGDAAIQLI